MFLIKRIVTYKEKQDNISAPSAAATIILQYKNNNYLK